MNSSSFGRHDLAPQDGELLLSDGSVSKKQRVSDVSSVDEFPVDEVLVDEFGDEYAGLDYDSLDAAASQAEEVAASQQGEDCSGGLKGLDRDADWQKIINQHLEKGARMKINATAGSGKTTVLADYAKKHGQFRYCYLCFNKAVQTEKGDEFADLALYNVTTVTTHSLAYRATMSFFNKKLKSHKRFSEYNYFDVIDMCGKLERGVDAKDVLDNAKFGGLSCQKKMCGKRLQNTL